MTPPTEAEAAAVGLTVEEASPPPVEIWPDNLQPLMVFEAMATQWVRAGMVGECVGLNYAVLPEVWRRTKTPIAERDDTFDCLRVMEVAALEHMAAMRKKAEKK